MLSLNKNGELVFKCIDFILNAWNDKNNQGLWLWGNPIENNDYYLKLGNLNDTYITYTKSGELIINADTLYIGGSSVKDSLDNLSKQDVLVSLLNGDGDAMYLADFDNDGKSELYIKATAIATGIIQS